MSGYDLSLSIGGEIRDAEAGRRLVLAILETEMATEWDFGQLSDSDDVLEHIAGCKGGFMTMMCRPGDDGEADPILAAAREIGLSYNLSIGYNGEDDFRFERAWRPGWAEEISAGSQDNDFHVSLETLSKAVAEAQRTGDLAPVVALRDGVKAVHTNPPPLVVDPAILARLGELSEEEWDEGLAESAPAP